MLTEEALESRQVPVPSWWANDYWAADGLVVEQPAFVSYWPSWLRDNHMLAWKIMATERVLFVAIARLEAIYNRYRMYRLGSGILDNIQRLDYRACAFLGCNRNLEDLQILATLCASVN
eukprot:IDg6355t1